MRIVGCQRTPRRRPVGSEVGGRRWWQGKEPSWGALLGLVLLAFTLVFVLVLVLRTTVAGL